MIWQGRCDDSQARLHKGRRTVRSLLRRERTAVITATYPNGVTGHVAPWVPIASHAEAPEFARDVLDALRQPLEAGEVTISRSGATTCFPARFTLVLASNPCPCARVAGPAEGCRCSPAARRRYLGRLSGPLLDRVDVKIELEPVSRRELLSDRSFSESSQTVALRVVQARERAAHRLRDTPWRLNDEVPGSELRRTWPPAPGSLAVLERSLERGLITARGVVKIVRVAWTLADLAGRPRPTRDDCDAALGLWLGVRR